MNKILLRLLLAIVFIIVLLVVNLALFNLTAAKVTEGVPIDNPDPEAVALVVIDILEGTTGDISVSESYKGQSEVFIRNVNRVIDDAHAKGYILIYITSEVVNPLINILNNTMARGSEGAKLDKRVLVKPGHMIAKRKNDPFTNPELDRILTESHVGKLVLVGLDAAFCVTSTVQAAKNRGYRISVIEEAVISETEAQKKNALEEFRKLGLAIVSLK
jgi:nicotinamidase/pyrazinamidase